MSSSTTIMIPKLGLGIQIMAEDMVETKQPYSPQRSPDVELIAPIDDSELSPRQQCLKLEESDSDIPQLASLPNRTNQFKRKQKPLCPYGTECRLVPKDTYHSAEYDHRSPACLEMSNSLTELPKSLQVSAPSSLVSSPLSQSQESLLAFPFFFGPPNHTNSNCLTCASLGSKHSPPSPDSAVSFSSTATSPTTTASPRKRTFFESSKSRSASENFLSKVSPRNLTLFSFAKRPSRADTKANKAAALAASTSMSSEASGAAIRSVSSPGTLCELHSISHGRSNTRSERRASRSSSASSHGGVQRKTSVSMTKNVLLSAPVTPRGSDSHKNSGSGSPRGSQRSPRTHSGHATPQGYMISTGERLSAPDAFRMFYSHSPPASLSSAPTTPSGKSNRPRFFKTSKSPSPQHELKPEHKRGVSRSRSMPRQLLKSSAWRSSTEASSPLPKLSSPSRKPSVKPTVPPPPPPGQGMDPHARNLTFIPESIRDTESHHEPPPTIERRYSISLSQEGYDVPEEGDEKYPDPASTPSSNNKGTPSPSGARRVSTPSQFFKNALKLGDRRPSLTDILADPRNAILIKVPKAFQVEITTEFGEAQEARRLSKHTDDVSPSRLALEDYFASDVQLDGVEETPTAQSYSEKLAKNRELMIEKEEERILRRRRGLKSDSDED
eukprot:gb/GEZN01003079.1/.p1 GENE.gb/GEZN01003079.1/~~gb/GEZN01003079.1/.p1  ORF type:complete len:668 (-),score=60.86 gb/GEZN01003079.1/:229-2232(-)